MQNDRINIQKDLNSVQKIESEKNASGKVPSKKYFCSPPPTKHYKGKIEDIFDQFGADQDP